MGAPGMRKKAPPQAAYDIADEDDMYVSRSHSSARRYKQPVQHDTLDDPLLLKDAVIQQRRSSVVQPTQKSTGPGAVSKPLRRVKRGPGQRPFTMVALVLGMLLMALLVFAATAFSSWWRVYQDDLHYGRPRTFQLDAVVGHQDDAGHPTHFIFLNLNRHVEIIELPAGQASHAHIYQGPLLYGPGQDLTPVTAVVRDVNGDGKPDLVIHIQDQQWVLINDGKQFRPQQLGDSLNV
jgi:hypothetical protein